MPPLGSLTVRISNLPPSISQEKVVATARSKFSEYISEGESLECLKSLITPNPNDAGKTQVAVVTLNRPLPTLFSDKGDEETLSFDFDGDCHIVTIDRHFRGLTCLHNGGAVEAVDLIFVTGLAGHAYGSWKASGKTTMWIEDFLIKENFKDQFRVLVYGYNSMLVKSTSVAGISDFAHTFLAVVARARTLDKNSQGRKIIFFGHSLGGLVVKEAICTAASVGPGNPGYYDVLRSTSAAFFFGVPNSGIRVEEWKYMVQGQPNWDLIHDLRPESTYLRLLHEHFRGFVREKLARFRIVTILETRETETVKEVNGVWKRAGETKLMVPRSSALSNINEAPDDILLRDADHSGVAKFSSSSDPEYELLKERIEKYVYEAQQVIEETGGSGTTDITKLEKRYFDVPYSRNPGYVQRKDISLKLEELLLQKNEDEQIKVAICALGGAGKTQVLLNFAYQSRENHHVFWLYGSSLELIEAGFVKIAATVGLSKGGLEAEKICLMLKDWLDSEVSGNWILLVDAVDSLDETLTAGIQKYLPSKRGTIIFTTRNRDITGKLVYPGYCLELSEGMTNDEALATFRPYGDQDINADDQESVMVLLEELEFFPLAIAQAAGYLRKTGIRVNEYRERLRKHDFKLLSQQPTDQIGGPSPEAVMKTWDISYQHIKERNSSATKLLEVLSLLAYQEISMSLFIFETDNPMSTLDIEDEIDFDNAVSELLSFNLVYSFRSATGESTFKLHRLVSLWTRHLIKDRLDTKTAALDVVRLKFPDPVQATLQECSKLALHVEAILKNVAQDSTLGKTPPGLKNRYADYLHYSCQFSTADTFYRESFEYYEKALGKDHYVPNQIATKLAWNLMKLGKHGEAREWLQRVLSNLKPTTKQMAETHADALQRMGYSYCSQDQDFNKGLEYYHQALKEYTKTFGENYQATLEVTSLIGSAYGGLGRFDEALQFCKRAQSGLELHLGSDNENTILNSARMAAIYYKQGKYNEALEWQQQCLEYYEKTFGKNHNITMLMLDSIGLSLQKLGRFEEALESHQRALTGQIEVLGPLHPETLISTCNIGSVYFGREEYREALEKFEYVVITGQTALPPGHGLIYHAVRMVAQSYEKLGEDLPEKFKELLNLAGGPYGNMPVQPPPEIRLDTNERVRRRDKVTGYFKRWR
ncbi:hypothetical protein TWF788_001394 [Orbilia oligospora]|uniref:Uncharacterized protein n=1 Tax=Orbilia oligospora TaxID=2813651 RepID=A0A6G1M9J5_ORBOL|nr:hypothetical protein TWF788_001394 [Orbilia oligospora]KAF3248265.1 hypothetical protein TWF192_006262 [Orbilia oligospora]